MIVFKNELYTLQLLTCRPYTQNLTVTDRSRCNIHDIVVLLGVHAITGFTWTDDSLSEDSWGHITHPPKF